MAVSTDRLTGKTGRGNADAVESYRQLLELSPVPMMVCDPAGLVAQMNEPAIRLLCSDGDAVGGGRDFLAFFAPGSVDTVRSLFSSISAGDVTEVSARVRCRRDPDRTFEAELAGKAAAAQGRSDVVWTLSVLSQAGPSGSDVSAEHRRLVEAIESISQGFAVFAPDGTLSAFNDNYRLKIWSLLADFIRVGLKFEEIVRETIRRNVWQSVGLDVEAFVRAALARHENVPSVHEIEYPDGRCIQQSKRRTSDGGIVAVYSEISDLRRREADIAEAQERHRRLLETLPDGVTILSGGKFAYVNPAAIRMFGARSHTDLVGRNAFDLALPENRAEIAAELDRVLSERLSAVTSEQRRIRLDGRVIQVELRQTYILWNAKPAILTVVRDLTEQKQAQHVLRETERRYLSIASNLPGAVYQRVLHADGSVSYPYISRGVIETHGLPAETVIRAGSLLMRAVHPEDRSRFMEALNESAENLTPFDVEVRNIKPDGRVVWIRSVARPHRRDDGAVVWDGIFVDITARKLAEDKATQTYQWLMDAVNALSDGFVLWDSDDRLVLWNDRFLEYHPQRDKIVRAGTSFDTMIDMSSKNLRATMGDAVGAWVAERKRQHDAAAGHHEMQTSTGRWLLVTERKTHEGYTVGVYSDITAAKKADAELRESEERYRQLVQLSPDAVIVHLDGIIVFANEPAVRIFGASDVADFEGRDVRDLVAPEDRLEVLSRRSRVADGDPPMFSRYRYLRLDGEVRHCESALSKFTWNGESAYIVIVRDIEDRVRAERQQAIFAAVLDQAADAIEIASADFRLRYVNPAFERMTGYESGEVVGAHQYAIHHAVATDPAFYEAIEQTLRSGTAWSGVLPAVTRDGELYQQEASIAPVFDSSGAIENFVAIKRNITERIETEIALRESEERYRKLLALSPDAIYVHVDSVVVLANAAAVEMFGAKDADDLVGRSIFDLIHSDVRPIAEANQQRLDAAAADTLRLDQIRQRLDGSEFWANASITPLNWQGKRGALVILRDITEARRANEKLIQAMEAAEIANASKSEFLANMSHELRTPLNAIIGFSEIMHSEMFGPIGDRNYREYARNIHESGMHLLHVINDILDLSKIEAGRMNFSADDVELGEVVEESVRIFTRAAEGAGVSIEVMLEADLPRLSADRRMIKQMIMNLVSNAIKFTPTGGRVRVRARRGVSGFVEIAVVDNGIGIGREDLGRVLEPFVQAGGGLGLSSEGTGLGLPLTRSFAELHGGNFRIWSRPGVGTRSVLTLPVIASFASQAGGWTAL